MPEPVQYPNLRPHDPVHQQRKQLCLVVLAGDHWLLLVILTEPTGPSLAGSLYSYARRDLTLMARL